MLNQFPSLNVIVSKCPLFSRTGSSSLSKYYHFRAEQSSLYIMCTSGNISVNKNVMRRASPYHPMLKQNFFTTYEAHRPLLTFLPFSFKIELLSFSSDAAERR